MSTQLMLQRAPSISSCFPERFIAHRETNTTKNNPIQTCKANDASYSFPRPQSLIDKHPVVEQPPEVLKTQHATTYSHHGDPATENTKALFLHPASASASASASTSSNSNNPLQDKLAVPLPPLPSFLINKKNAASRRSLYAPLYHAATKGDWENAEEFLRSHPGALNVRITEGMDTLLHIAAGAMQIKFVEEVVKLMTPADLELRNKSSNTALFYAAASGVTRIAEVMVQKNRNLPGVRNNEGFIPLHVAAFYGHREMVWYLCSATNLEDLKLDDYAALLIAVISTDLFDVALNILQDQPELATIRDLNGMTPLHILAQKPSAFASRCSLTPWHRMLYPLIHDEEPSQVCCFSSHLISQNSNNYQASSSLLQKIWHATAFIVPGINFVHSKKSMHMQALGLVKILSDQLSLLDDSEICDLLTNPMHLLLVAAEFGIVEVVTEVINSYPDIIWKIDKQNRSIFHIAVKYRQEKIFNLIHGIGVHKEMITSCKDANGQNILHLAGKLAPLEHLSDVSGAALQMQRELLWFKEVEKTVQPLARQMRDKSGRTPRMLFSEEHRALVKEGEEWMKSTASSCMLVATLITTMMFAAIFTVPGGDDNTKGTPIFLQSNTFTAFAVSDAFALFSSVTSILMFLSILTSRYAEEDFLESLPKRLIVGLTTLFLSIASMLVAFSATFFIVLGHRVAWIIAPIAFVACIPVTLFAFLQFPLLADMFHSCYGPGIFAREKEVMKTSQKHSPSLHPSWMAALLTNSRVSARFLLQKSKVLEAWTKLVREKFRALLANI